MTTDELFQSMEFVKELEGTEFGKTWIPLMKKLRNSLGKAHDFFEGKVQEFRQEDFCGYIGTIEKCCFQLSYPFKESLDALTRDQIDTILNAYIGLKCVMRELRFYAERHNKGMKVIEGYLDRAIESCGEGS